MPRGAWQVMGLVLRFIMSSTLGASAAMAVALALGLGGMGLLQTKIINPWFHDPAIRKAALDGYVAEVKLIAAQSSLDEAKRQVAAGEAVLKDLQTKLADSDAEAAMLTQKLEQEIADRETILGTRRCGLTRADIEWLRKQ